MRRISCSFLTLLLVLQLFSQDQTKDFSKEFNALNNYVEYLNKSVHGLFVIHKLLEIQNQEINKYVDLESHKMYDISNSDISPNVFTENSFYENRENKSQRNPYELLTIARSESIALPKPVAELWNNKTAEIKDILEVSNGLRFEIEDYLNDHDLNDRNQVYGAYELLEKAKSSFFRFYTLQLDFYRDLEKYSNIHASYGNEEELILALNSIHETTRLILDALRFKNDNSFGRLTDQLKTALNSYSIIVDQYSEELKYTQSGILDHLKKVESKIGEVVLAAEHFTSSGSVPEKFKQYGKYYHYHNNEILMDMNWVGFGFVQEMNSIIEKLELSTIKYLEIPLFFQVIYPMKMDTLGHIASTDPLIDKIPKKLKNRNIKESKFKIQADSNVVVLKLFDHLLQDGDIVSINFNGDWILEKHSIETKSKELILKLNPNGKNFLLLHADSEGRRPPNTLGIKYTYKGEKKEIELRSDLNSSELIEIVRPEEK